MTTVLKNGAGVNPSPIILPTREELALDWLAACMACAESESTDFQASEDLLSAKRAHDDAVNKILVEHAENPKVLGANEAAREATIASMTTETLQALREAEETKRTTGFAVREADDEKSRLRELRRILFGVEVTVS